MENGSISWVDVDQEPPTIDVFETSIGWFGILHSDSKILRIKFGFEHQAQATRAFSEAEQVVAVSDHEPTNWRKIFQDYANGKRVDFSELEIDSCWMTPFQRKVITACRKIPFGNTVTYGELAESIGSPGAARAVGSTMRTNRFPVVVPCHRVVGASGLGGYSASQGVETKRRLLSIENAIESETVLQPLFD